MLFTDEQIIGLAANANAVKAANKLTIPSKWNVLGANEKAIWGEIQGSGKSSYYVQVDRQDIAYKCSCPSRQFPCKHGIALLLLTNRAGDAFNETTAPDWVTEWIDKRNQKSEAKPVKTTTKKSTSKAPEKRLKSVQQGAQDIEQWLNDIARVGILQLPNIPKSEFDQIAARMVDAKATGLAHFIRQLQQLNFTNSLKWQQEAVRITSKLYLLLQTFKQFNKLDTPWQATIKPLLGWSQSPKALLENKAALSVTDEWLILGKQTEQNDKITTIRHWLIGQNTQHTALILQFNSPYQPNTEIIPDGKSFEGTVRFFESTLPQRGLIIESKETKDITAFTKKPFENWAEVVTYKATNLQLNPWSDDHIFCIKNIRIAPIDKSWCLVDSEQQLLELHESVEFETILQWKVYTGNQAVDISGIIRNEKVIPLGILMDNKYNLL